MAAIKQILFATDFSEASAGAAEQAIYLAGLTGANLHVLHVIDELAESQRVMVPSEAFQTLQKEVELQAFKDLESFCRKVPQTIVTTSHAVIGKPFQKILETATEVAADLIVVGTHGRTGIEHVIVGSTAERIVRRSSVPVLTVRT